MVVTEGFVESSVVSAPVGTKYQFERLGYFCIDKDSTPERLVFNRTATLRDTWAKIAKTQG
jgi:glutaminyl-tRNA synthetase